MTLGSVKVRIDERDDGEQVIAFTTPWSASFQLRDTPGARYIGRRQRWEMPLSWASCVILRSVFGRDIEIGSDVKAWAREERRKRVDLANELRDMIDLDGDHEDVDGEHWQRLYPFQRAGREFLTTAKSALLADEQGTGKTIQVLTALRQTNAYPAIVICPNSVKRNWAREIEAWLPEANPFVVDGSAKKKRETIKAAREADNAVVIINIESVRLFSRLAPYSGVRLLKCTECDKRAGDPGLSKSRCQVHVKELNEMMFGTCVLDEAHRVKDPKAQQTRAIWSIFHNPAAEYRWALTGTPMANHPGDLWSIMHAVAPEDFCARTRFIDRYAQQSWNAFGAMDIIGLRPDTKEEFFKILNPRFRRMQKSIVLKQLPPKVRTIRTVEMSPKQKRAYDELAEGLVTLLDDGTLLVAPNNLTAATRLLQLSSSYCKIDELECPNCAGEMNEMLDCLKCHGSGVVLQVEPMEPSTKIDDLVQLIRENEGNSIAVAAEHRRLLDLAAARLAKENIPCVMITGKVDTDERTRNLELFQEGKVPVILFTYKAGGVGLTMNRANTLIRLQRSWSLIDNLQGEDRVHRIGSEQHDSINIIDIVTDGTVEVQQCLRLHDKSRRLEEIVRDREQLVKRGVSTADIDDERERLENAFLGEA